MKALRGLGKPLATTIQLEPIAVETPLGRGYAIVLETGPDDSFWTVILNDTRAFVTFRQRELRAARCYTYGRGVSDEQMKDIISHGG